jgi:hypothetical protein
MHKSGGYLNVEVDDVGLERLSETANKVEIFSCGNS